MSAPLQIPTNPATPFHAVATAIEARLRLGFPDPLFQISMISPSPTAQELARALAKKPFLGLAFVGLSTDATQRQLKGVSQWTVLCAVENTGGTKRRYFGDNGGIGLFGTLTCAGALLHGWTVPDVGTVHVKSIDSVHPEGWTDDATAMGLITIEVNVATAIAPGAEVDLADFLKLTAVWLAPGIELPAVTTQVRGA